MTELLCPACKKGSLSVSVAVCTDNECCGCSHLIFCDNCNVDFETQSNIRLADEWLRLGGDLDDLED